MLVSDMLTICVVSVMLRPILLKDYVERWLEAEIMAIHAEGGEKRGGVGKKTTKRQLKAK